MPNLSGVSPWRIDDDDDTDYTPRPPRPPTGGRPGARPVAERRPPSREDQWGFVIRGQEQRDTDGQKPPLSEIVAGEAASTAAGKSPAGKKGADGNNHGRARHQPKELTSLQDFLVTAIPTLNTLHLDTYLTRSSREDVKRFAKITRRTAPRVLNEERLARVLTRPGERPPGSDASSDLSDSIRPPGSSLFTAMSVVSDPATRDMEAQRRRQRDVELRELVTQRFNETVQDLGAKCAALEASLAGAGLSKYGDEITREKEKEKEKEREKEKEKEKEKARANTKGKGDAGGPGDGGASGVSKGKLALLKAASSFMGKRAGGNDTGDRTRPGTPTDSDHSSGSDAGSDENNIAQRSMSGTQPAKKKLVLKRFRRPRSAVYDINFNKPETLEKFRQECEEFRITHAEALKRRPGQQRASGKSQTNRGAPPVDIIARNIAAVSRRHRLQQQQQQQQQQQEESHYYYNGAHDGYHTQSNNRNSTNKGNKYAGDDDWDSTFLTAADFPTVGRSDSPASRVASKIASREASRAASREASRAASRAASRTDDEEEESDRGDGTGIAGRGIDQHHLQTVLEDVGDDHLANVPEEEEEYEYEGQAEDQRLFEDERDQDWPYAQPRTLHHEGEEEEEEEEPGRAQRHGPTATELQPHVPFYYNDVDGDEREKMRVAREAFLRAQNTFDSIRTRHRRQRPQTARM